MCQGVPARGGLSASVLGGGTAAGITVVVQALHAAASSAFFVQTPTTSTLQALVLLQ